MKKTIMLTLLIFAVATTAGCGKKAPPMPPDETASAAVTAPDFSTT